MRFGVLDDDHLRLELLTGALESQGFEVSFGGALDAYAGAVTAAEALILVGPTTRLRPLCAKAATAGADARPIVLMTAPGCYGDLLPLITGSVHGVVTFAQGIARLGPMLRELGREQRDRGVREGSADAARRGLSVLRGVGASGLLHVRVGATVGQILLHQGQIVDAEVGSMRGEDAAAALVAGLSGEVQLDWTSLEEADEGEGEEDLEDIVLELDEPIEDGAREGARGAAELELRPLHGGDLAEISDEVRESCGQVHVLFVDDDEAIRKMLSTTLTHRGFKVTTAVDGREGFAVALRERPHLIVSDVMMPKLDGWGFLSLLRADYRLRETPVALLSCHSEHLEYLARLGAGADAYLPKGVRLDEVVNRVRELADARVQVLSRIVPGASLSGRFARLGPLSLLRCLAERNATGLLTVEDSWATYTLGLSAGVVACAGASFGSSELEDQEALRSLIGVHRGTWSLDAQVEPDRWSLHRPALEVMEEIAKRATEEEQAIREQMITGTAGLVADADRIEFYERVCPLALQPVVARVKRGVSPREILADGGASPLVIDWLFKDMLTKGVVHFREVS